MDYSERAVREAEEATKQVLARVEEVKGQISLVELRQDSLDIDAEQARNHELAMLRERERTRRTVVFMGAIVILGVAAMAFL